MPSEIVTDAYVDIAGDAAILLLNAGNANGAAAVGGTMLFKWMLDSVLITIATTPDDTGYEVRPKAALTDAQFAEQLVVDLNKNVKLSNNFTIEVVSTSSVRLIAKIKGTSYVLRDFFATTNFGYELDSTPQIVLDTVYNQNYKMHVDVFVENTHLSGTYIKAGSSELDPLNNICTFYVEEFLNANLEYYIPNHGDNTINQCTKNIKRFYVEYYEKFGNPVVPRIKHTTSVGTVLKAGVTKQEWLQSFKTITSLYITPKYFLTRQPRTKKIVKHQQEFLFWLVTDKINGHKRRTVVYYTDGTTHTNDTSVFGDETNQLFCVPTGYDQINIDSFNPTKTVYKYTVAVINGATPTHTSELFTYHVDTDVYYDETFLFFTTSDGGLDTQRCTGVKENGFETEKDTIQNIVLWKDGPQKGEFSEFNHQTQTKYKINTGWITKETAEWFEEFFVAEKKFIQSQNMAAAKLLLPIQLITSAAKKYDSITNLYNYEIEVAVAFKNITTVKAA
jgi:hypothetical protein